MADNNKSCLTYLNELVGQCNDTYHCSVGKNVLMLTIVLWLKKLN